MDFDGNTIQSITPYLSLIVFFFAPKSALFEINITALVFSFYLLSMVYLPPAPLLLIYFVSGGEFLIDTIKLVLFFRSALIIFIF